MAMDFRQECNNSYLAYLQGQGTEAGHQEAIHEYMILIQWCSQGGHGGHDPPKRLVNGFFLQINLRCYVILVYYCDH